ncbi:MAG TPA: 1-phosphofructokinase family hexose kinase [Fimbriimonadaceae bacterium]|nr:1-phosphofructokinase family hexose kinase [Fimbriimonadaceae bacterium]
MTVTVNPCVDETFFVNHLALHDTNRIDRIERDAGGKGVNVSRIVAALGGSVMAIGLAGGRAGETVKEVLRSEGVESRFVTVNVETRTNLCVEDGTELPPTTFDTAGPSVEAGTLDALLLVAEGILPESNWLMTGGSLPPGLPVDTHARLVRLAHQHRVLAAVDADDEPMRQALAAGPELIKPNVAEAERLTGRRLRSLSDIADCATELRAMMLVAGASGRALSVVSMGASGALMAAETGVFRGLSPRVTSRSSVGSGDSMLGAMLWSLANGGTPQAALRWGLAAGAATARTHNVGVATRAEIEELLPAAKVKSI